MGFRGFQFDGGLNAMGELKDGPWDTKACWFVSFLVDPHQPINICFVVNKTISLNLNVYSKVILRRMATRTTDCVAPV